jgi:hypothetical protein
LTGQRVLGPARVIQEVRNAITAYDALPRWDPAKPSIFWMSTGCCWLG